MLIEEKSLLSNNPTTPGINTHLSSKRKRRRHSSILCNEYLLKYSYDLRLEERIIAAF